MPRTSCISYINPKTGRCTTKSKNKGKRCYSFKNSAKGRCSKLKQCDTRRNPLTGRCVLRNSKVGKKTRGSRACLSFRDKETARCFEVKRRSRTKKRSKPRSHKTKKPTQQRNRVIPITYISPKILRIVEDCEQNKKWKKINCLGQGANGSVYCTTRIKDSKDERSNRQYAIKIQPFNSVAKQEIAAYIALQKSSIVPKLHAAWKCRGKLYIVIDLLTKCNPKPSLKQVKYLLGKLERLGWLHVDTHDKNILCTPSGRLVLIDLGWAVSKTQKIHRHPSGRKTYDELKAIQYANAEEFFV